MDRKWLVDVVAEFGTWEELAKDSTLWQSFLRRFATSHRFYISLGFPSGVTDSWRFYSDTPPSQLQTLAIGKTSSKTVHVCPHCNFTTYMSQHMKSHLVSIALRRYNRILRMKWRSCGCSTAAAAAAVNNCLCNCT